ncbi:MAG TPA: ETC complex I subunit [Stellaceae bacterium]|nr:ETC complex I subunit [Stellaceae bacterium]
MSEVRILSPRPPAAIERNFGSGRGEMAQARIFRPAKTAMQSGRRETRGWFLEYEPASPREPDPLMGWASAGDTLNEVRLRFATLQEAIAFADRLGLDYTVIEPHDPTPKAKSYADNFRYDRVLA